MTRRQTIKAAIKLAAEILSQPQFADLSPLGVTCRATDGEKQSSACFLPRAKATLAKCQDCHYWRGER